MSKVCSNCFKAILEPNTTYGINPNAICKCSSPKPKIDPVLSTIKELQIREIMARLDELEKLSAYKESYEALNGAITVAVPYIEIKMRINYWKQKLKEISQ